MNSNPETAEELKEQIRVLRGGIERLGKVIDQIAQYCQKLQLNNEPYPADLTIQLKVSDYSKS